MTTPYPAVKWLAVAAILGTGAIHVVEARDSFAEARYKGLLFVANGLGAAVAALGLSRGEREWGWVLGLLIAGGAFLGYVASRTVGLPGLPAEPDAWLEPAGVASLVCEALFIVLFVVAHKRRTDPPP
jgi:hypothetical protein